MSWSSDAWGGGAHAEDAPAALPGAPPPPPPIVADLLDPRRGGALVWVVEVEAARDGGTLPAAGPAWAEDAWGAAPPAFIPAGGSQVLRVSDLGWRAPAGAPAGAAYPPWLLQGPDLDRRVALAPGANDTWGVGVMTFAPQAVLDGHDTAMRPVRVRVGQQGWDPGRGLVTDPVALGDVFSGLALTWRAGDAGNEVPLRDAAAWLDQPVGVQRFTGAGGAGGTPDLAGQPVPIVRGGDALNPVRACPARLVEPLTQIFRWSDAGTPVAVREDGAAVYASAGPVADVFAAAAPAAGAYVWDAAGHVRLGSVPQGQITVDGHGPDLLAATIVRDLLMGTMGLPAGLLDEGSVLATAGTAPQAAGWAWTGGETGREAVQPLLRALNARLVPARAGGLRLWPLRALPADARPAARLDATSAVACDPVPLDGLMPPAAAWTVGYGRTHTLTSTPKPTVSAADRERLAAPWRTAAWGDAANLLRYAQPARPPLVETALLTAGDAAALAGVLGALWGVPRTLWRVTVPAGAALARDIGDVVQLGWDIPGLRNAPLGQVVGDSVRAGEPAGALLILV